MKNILIFILVVIVVTGCADGVQQFKVLNQSDISYENKEVIISKNQLTTVESKLPVVYFEDQAVPTQLDDTDGDGNWDELVYQVSMEPNAQQTYSIKWVEVNQYPDFEKKTQVHFGFSKSRNDEFVSLDQVVRPEGHVMQKAPYTYQFEGPGWESNLVGFRNYFDPRNGKDIFGKTTEKMAVHEIIDGYHDLKPWGMDILKVGNSLGAGALAIMKGDSLIRLGYTDNASFEKVAEGPVRSKFKLNYKGWNVLGGEYELTETITIWANKRWYQSVVKLSPTNQDTLVTGIVNLNDAKVGRLSTSDFEILYTHGVQSENKDNLGMGVLVSSSNLVNVTSLGERKTGITSTELVSLSASDNAYQFWFYAGWEKENEGFAELDFFESQLQSTAAQISADLLVTFPE